MTEPTTRPEAVLYYHPDGFDVGREKLMGRHVAGAAFLEGYVRHAGVSRFVCAAATEAHARDFAQRVSGYGGGDAPVEWRRLDRPDRYADPGVLMWPGPDLGAEAWRRRRVGDKAYSLCGLTHTLCTERVMDFLAEYLIAPLQPWDALICTSRAAASMVRAELAAQADYLRDRLGATRLEGPELAVIPLAINPDGLAHDPGARQSWRERLGIPEKAAVVCFVGRLSHHGKAHPFPLFTALQQAAQRGGPPVRLILFGRSANEAQAEVFRVGARKLCPDVTVHVVDGRDPGGQQAILSASDIFAFLSDNIQETFGLAPVEAMAAGLPVVASDWDGVRDTVAHGETGFLIPTVAPPSGGGEDLALRHHAGVDSYDLYIGQTAQATAVDIGAAAEAFAALIADPDLRRRMGEAGRARVAARFDWKVVIGQYQALWAELNARRSAREVRAPLRKGAAPVPVRMDPFRLFASFPTRALASADIVTPTGDVQLLDWLLAAPGGIVSTQGAVPREVMAGWLADRSARTADSLLASATTVPERIAMIRSLLWMAKMGLVAIAPAAQRDGAGTGT